MNLKEIRELIILMNENDLTEIEIEREGNKVKISKSVNGDVITTIRPQSQSVSAPIEVQSQVKTQPEEVPKPENPNLKEISSPMVGTFYRAPSPEAPPFVDVGQVVEVGQVVCIVEAMKLMNEIKSEVRGKVVEIPIENAQPVEFGQTLFLVEPV